MSTKDKVLKALEEKKGNYISGEELAKTIGVSRNSVWKAVNELKAVGYNIDSVTNRGYSLSKTSDIISAQGIAAYLYNKDDALNIEVYDEIASTSRLAKEEAAMNNLNKRVIIAKTQTQGRGHGRKSFDSPEGGIYFSVIISPDFINMNYLPIYAAVVVSDVLGKTQSDIRIKWVNNIYLHDKKICGILTENISDMETGEISSFIIGIGVNCKIGNKNELIAEILNRLFYPEIYYPEDNIIEIYQKRLLYMNERVKFLLRGKKETNFFATILGVDEDGRLIVRLDDGIKRYLKKGEIID
ncbi:MAG: biotin--[Lachnospiraceae bacterium]|nr:biotin--[acetyl-CoA-carboxylase] ligase [Lachnospiraceae bacterium]